MESILKDPVEIQVPAEFETGYVFGAGHLGRARSRIEDRQTRQRTLGISGVD